MMPTQSIANQENSDLQKIVKLFTRNYKLFIFSMVIAMGMAFLVSRFKIPEYKISSSLLIKEETRRPGGNVNEFLNSSLFGVNQNFQNELWVLKSNPVIEQTIRNLNLMVSYFHKEGFQYLDAYDNMPFRVLLLKDHVQPVNVRFSISIRDKGNFEIRAKAKQVSFVNFNTNEVVSKKESWQFEQYSKFGKLIETPELAFVVKIDTTSKYYYKDDFIYSFVLSDAVSLTNSLKNQLEFNVIDRMATVIEIEFKSPSVKKGKDIVNELMNVYSQQNLERKNHIAGITIDYIEKQLDEISDSLSLTEDNLQRFRSSNQLLNVTEQATGISAQYMDLQNKLAELVTRKRYYDYVADYLAKNDDFSNMIVPASMGIPDQVLNSLMSELITAQAQRSNLIENNQERNPLVQKLGIQIENIKKTISENIAAVRKTTDISLDEMNKRIRKVESEISRLPKTQRQLGGIERKYRLNDAIYNYLLEKRAEAKITQASNLPDDIVIEPAKMQGTDPVSPNKKKIYLIAIFLGLAVPFGYLTLKSLISNKIESQENLERLTEAPVLGKIMHSHRKTNNVVFEYPKSSITESYRALRTNLEYHFKGVSRKVIMITSCIEGEGKSFNALNLAMNYAQLGRHTLLLDFDLRKPTGYFSKAQESLVGLSSWYIGRADLNDIILHSPHDKLDYIESGPIPPNPVELLAIDKTETLLGQLKTMYDCIILDTTPLAQVSDAYLLMDHADIKIVIARYNFSIKKVFSLIMKDLKQKNISNICVMLNDNRFYSDQYGYGYGYKKEKTIV
jgi:tyrosine-protein kinase Etk/Wzc